ncbi:cytochrome c oxidase assembly protein [uncultured Sphingomonas sp.]|uniref:cytochrome c oxidase assembly protein n=1 Tax=Sphingomonas sp. TaxID=28214 RepID=UPI0026049718|nr:cytochrome c oxidase assembly protein [uncultured Sphingomonas sp.]
MRLTRQARTVVFAVLGVVFMTGLAWGSVPLYRLFCQVTGFQGTTQRGDEAPGGVNHKIRVDFDANVSPHLPWSFKPENPSETIDIGARDMVFFTATNRSDKPVTGTATFNVTPMQAGKYFTKIQCFCFTQQTLKPRETVRMPVIFFVDPKILSDPDAQGVETITLSYTFYPVDSAARTS